MKEYNEWIILKVVFFSLVGETESQECAFKATVYIDAEGESKN